MATKKSPVLNLGHVVVVLNRAEFEAVDFFAQTGLSQLRNRPEAFPDCEHEMAEVARAQLDQVRAVFAKA